MEKSKISDSNHLLNYHMTNTPLSTVSVKALSRHKPTRVFFLQTTTAVLHIERDEFPQPRTVYFLVCLIVCLASPLFLRV